ncbi:MAG: hypothetical protein ACRENB_01570 [Gemmatimonadales bacterium]
MQLRTLLSPTSWAERAIEQYSASDGSPTARANCVAFSHFTEQGSARLATLVARRLDSAGILRRCAENESPEIATRTGGLAYSGRLFESLEATAADVNAEARR